MYKLCREFKPPVEESLHERLRRETARTHEALETLIDTRRFFASRAGYSAFLSASQAFQSEAERVLDESGVSDVIPDWPLRRRAQLACADLEALGSTPSPGPALIGQLTKVPTPEWVLGIAYVLEGSTLGGGVLLKTVARLGVSPERGASFLASYGANRGAMWQSFLATLASWERRAVAQEKVVGAALAAFAAARSYFTSVGLPEQA